MEKLQFRRCDLLQAVIVKERFEFITDAQAAEFCSRIASRMVSVFGITLDEAIGRMNRDWKGLNLIGSNDVIYHEDEDYWAKTIYYGKGSNWWLNPPDLRPRPYGK